MLTNGLQEVEAQLKAEAASMGGMGPILKMLQRPDLVDIIGRHPQVTRLPWNLLDVRGRPHARQLRRPPAARLCCASAVRRGGTASGPKGHRAVPRRIALP